MRGCIRGPAAVAIARLLLGALMAACGSSYTAQDSLGECPEETWCWIRGRPLHSLSGPSLERVVITGDEGFVGRWSEGSWVDLFLPVRRPALSAAVVDDTELWVADAEGGLWHYLDGQWSEDSGSDASVRGLSVTSDGTLWLERRQLPSVGDRGQTLSLWRREREGWTHHVDAPQGCVERGSRLLALARDEVFAAELVCGTPGLVSGVQVHRYMGSTWMPMGEVIPFGSTSVELVWWDDSLYVHGHVTHRWAAGVWEELVDDEGAPAPPWNGFDGIACSQALRVDGQVFCTDGVNVLHRVDDTAGFEATRADPFVDTMAADRWGTVPAALWAGGYTLSAFGTHPMDVYRSSDGMLEHYDGQRWSSAFGQLGDWVSGAGPGHVVAVPAQGFVLLGKDPSLVEIPQEFGGPTAKRAQALSGGEVLALTSRHALLWDGEFHILYEAPDDFRVEAIAADARDNIWLRVVRWSKSSPQTLTLHYDGKGWSDVDEVQDINTTLVLHKGEVWIGRAEGIQRLSPAGPLIEAELDSHSRLYVTDDHLWIGTRNQMQRRRR